MNDGKNRTRQNPAGLDERTYQNNPEEAKVERGGSFPHPQPPLLLLMQEKERGCE
jgi:hypothetical protein